MISSDVFLVSAEEKKPSNEAVAEYLEGRKKYEELKKQELKKGKTREAQVKQLHVWFKSIRRPTGESLYWILFKLCLFSW